MRSTIEIVDFSAEYSADFRRLNEEWLEAFFRVEDVDARVLGDPQSSIIDPGGIILFAKSEHGIIGTVALKRYANSTYELTKMAVTQKVQGGGVGKRLLEAAIARFTSLDGQRLYLETHSSLRAAISLYERAGFHHATPPEPSPYERADVYMIYQPK